MGKTAPSGNNKPALILAAVVAVAVSAYVYQSKPPTIDDHDIVDAESVIKTQPSETPSPTVGATQPDRQDQIQIESAAIPNFKLEPGIPADSRIAYDAYQAAIRESRASNEATANAVDLAALESESRHQEQSILNMLADYDKVRSDQDQRQAHRADMQQKLQTYSDTVLPVAMAKAKQAQSQ